MGVKNFNKIKDRYGAVIQLKDFSKVIIDASNLLHTYMSAWYSTLEKACGKFSFGGLREDLVNQCAFIVGNTFKVLKNYILSILKDYKPKYVYLVFDPITTPDYLMDTGESWIDVGFLKEMYPEADISRKNRRIIHINMKEQEQKKRKGVDPIIKALERFGDKGRQEKIEELVRSTMLLGSQHRIIVLSESLLPLLLDEFKSEERVHFVRAKYEADLLIKNLAAEEPHGKTLVKSKDTDYYFLLSDFEWCYCSDIKRNADIYHPSQIWKELLDDAFSYDLIVRLSPMFGNDYTVHKSILNAAKNDDVLTFLNLNGRFHSIKNMRVNTILRKIYNAAERSGIIEDIDESESLSCDMIDELVHGYNFNYFESYYKSIIIYKQWGFYCDYDELKNKESDTLPSRLPIYIRSAITFDKTDIDSDEWEEFEKNSKIIKDSSELNTMYLSKLQKVINGEGEYEDDEEFYEGDVDDDYEIGDDDNDYV